MVMAVITGQLGQRGAGLTTRIGAGRFVPPTRFTLIPASEVGNLSVPANTGCVRVLPTPIANTVITCPGARLIGAGTEYPAPMIALGLAFWPSAETARAATTWMKRLMG